MALVREIRKRLFVQYQPVLVEADHEEPYESRYAFVKIVTKSATARGDAWKRQVARVRKVLALTKTKKPEKKANDRMKVRLPSCRQRC